MRPKIIMPAKRYLASAVLLLLTSVHSLAAEPNEYRLRVGDEVKITVFKEPDMSGVYKVGATGAVAVPGIGEIKGAGTTPEALREAAVQALAAQHHANPRVTVEIVQYSPVFIMGDVRNPGRQAYIPGLTALQLVALAGGYPLPLGYTEGNNLSRDVEKQRTDLAVDQERYVSLAMKRARLEAERDGKANFAIPSGVEAMVGKDRIEQIKDVEIQLLRTRIVEEEQRVKLLRKQAEEVVKGRVALEEQLEATKRLKSIVDAELRNIRELKERGLTANTRVLELERISADTEMRMNSAISLIAQSNQSIASIELLIKQASDAARVKVAEQMIETETEMVVTNRKIASAVEFLNLSGVAIPTGPMGQAEVTRRFSIVREGGAGEVLISESALVRPGDVLIVTRVMEGPSTAAAAPFQKLASESSAALPAPGRDAAVTKLPDRR